MSEQSGQCHHLRREPYTGDPYHQLAERDQGHWFHCLDCGSIYQDSMATEADETSATDSN
jgi:hypothetical protein